MTPNEKCDESLSIKKLIGHCKERGIKGYTKYAMKATKTRLADLCCDETGHDGQEKCFVPENEFTDGLDGIPARVENPLPVVTDPPTMPATYKSKLNASRKETNDFLKGVGYKWRKEEIYVDGGLASTYWELERYDGDFASVWALKKPDGSTLCYGYDPSCERKYKKVLLDNGFYGDEAIEYENQMAEHGASKQERARELRDRISEIKDYFREGYREKTFDRPEKVEPFPRECFHPNGKGFNIYGGGEEFVATNKGIWDVENNGMDGDDWSRNNYPTGGAGAVATKFPLDDRIKDIILSLPSRDN